MNKDPQEVGASDYRNPIDSFLILIHTGIVVKWPCLHYRSFWYKQFDWTRFSLWGILIPIYGLLSSHVSIYFSDVGEGVICRSVLSIIFLSKYFGGNNTRQSRS